MTNKDQVVTVVDSKPVAMEDIKSYITTAFSLEISDSKKLSDVACDFYIPSISDAQKQEIRKYFFLQKLDCCIQ